MVTSIQITEETKRKLLFVMAEIQKERRQKITYEDAINYLIEREIRPFETRRTFADEFRGIINKSQAERDLRGLRKLEK